jgi:hypothetical protein
MGSSCGSIWVGQWGEGGDEAGDGRLDAKGGEGEWRVRLGQEEEPDERKSRVCASAVMLRVARKFATESLIDENQGR